MRSQPALVRVLFAGDQQVPQLPRASRCGPRRLSARPRPLSVLEVSDANTPQFAGAYRPCAMRGSSPPPFTSRYRPCGVRLTHVLKEALGGHCRTRMVATMWSDNAHADETVATLKFASRMRAVKTTPKADTVAGAMTDNERAVSRSSEGGWNSFSPPTAPPPHGPSRRGSWGSMSERLRRCAWSSRSMMQW